MQFTIYVRRKDGKTVVGGQMEAANAADAESRCHAVLSLGADIPLSYVFAVPTGLVGEDNHTPKNVASLIREWEAGKPSNAVAIGKSVWGPTGPSQNWTPEEYIGLEAVPVEMFDGAWIPGNDGVLILSSTHEKKDEAGLPRVARGYWTLRYLTPEWFARKAITPRPDPVYGLSDLTPCEDRLRALFGVHATTPFFDTPAAYRQAWGVMVSMLAKAFGVTDF